MNKYVIITIAVIQNCLSGLKKYLKNNPGEKSLKGPFAIYLDLECLLKKEQSCENNNNNRSNNNNNNSNNNSNNSNNLEKYYTEKKARHEPSGQAIFTRCSFD